MHNGLNGLNGLNGYMARHKKRPGSDAKRAAEVGLKAEDTSKEWRLEQIG